MTKLTLYQSNTNEVRLPGLQNADTLAYITGATITATLYNPDGTAVTGYSNLAMTDVAGVPGTYSLVISSAFNAPVGNYNLIFSGTTPTGDGFMQYQPVEVKVRK